MVESFIFYTASPMWRGLVLQLLDWDDPRWTQPLFSPHSSPWYLCPLSPVLKHSPQPKTSWGLTNYRSTLCRGRSRGSSRWCVFEHVTEEFDFFFLLLWIADVLSVMAELAAGVSGWGGRVSLQFPYRDVPGSGSGSQVSAWWSKEGNI